MQLPAWLRRLSTHWKNHSTTRSTRFRRKHHSCQNILDYRYATAELLEDRTLLTTVTGTTPDGTGTLEVDATSLDIIFSELVNGADVAGNYALVAAGADGLLGSVDDVVISVDTASYHSGTNTATLSFAALVEGIYRLTVQDTITDGSSNALDGNDDGIAGGDFTVDFVVGAMTTSLTSPGGKTFDPETVGFGAGQLVEGANGEFDGLNRLRVGGEDYAPAVHNVPVSLSVQKATSTVYGSLSYSYSTLLTVSAGEAGVYQVSGQFGVTNSDNGNPNLKDAVIQYRILSTNHTDLGFRSAILLGGYGSLVQLHLDELLDLSEGEEVWLEVRYQKGSAELGLGPNALQHELQLTRLESVTGLSVQKATSTVYGSLSYSYSTLLTVSAGEAGVYQVSGQFGVTNSDNGNPNLKDAVIQYRILSTNHTDLGFRSAILLGGYGSLVQLHLDELLDLSEGEEVWLEVRYQKGSAELGLGPNALQHELQLTRLESVTGLSVQKATSTVGYGSLSYSYSTLLTMSAGEAGVYQVSGQFGVTNSDNGNPNLKDAVIQYRILSTNHTDLGFRSAILLGGYGSLVQLHLDELLDLSEGEEVWLEVRYQKGSAELGLGPNALQHELQLTRLGDMSIEFRFDDDLQTVITNTQMLSGLDVYRKVTVPNTGGQIFARTVEVFHNPTESAITETVKIVGNLGSDAETVVFNTSDGDTIIEPTDLWIGTDDTDGTDTPAIIHYIHGPQGLIPATVELVGDNIVWTYGISVNPGETVRLAHFTILDDSRADAEAAANALVSSTGFTGEAGSFLTSDELDSLLNFQFDAVPSDPPKVVYVDSDFINPVAGQDPDGAGSPATQFGFDAFTTIQAAIDAVADGGTIHIAAGTYSGNVEATTKSVILVPGNSTGQVVINGNLTLDSNDTLEMEINGTTPGSGFDQFVVNGTVALNGADLNLIDGYDPVNGDQFLLVDNDGTESVASIFSGLPEGYGFVDFLGVPGQTAYLTYVGGDGNDVLIHVSNLETVSLRLVPVPTATDANGEATALPANQNWISEWASYWVEIWVGTEDLLSQGIATVSLDLSYQTEFTSATEIGYGPAFSQNQTGTIDDPSGLIGNMSAMVDTTDLGVDQHLLFARIKFESLPEDQVLLDLEGQSIGPHDRGFALLNTQLSLGSERVNDAPVIYFLGADIWANPYDLNDDDAINFRDLLLFASVYNTIPAESSSQYAWFSDFNRNGRVAFQDLILLATNYNKSKSQQQEVIYPNNYPQAWDQRLQVSLFLDPPPTATKLTQDQADNALQSAVEDVRPKLSEQEQQKLAQVQVEVVDLTGNILGRVEGNTIYLDVNAAGYGWFIDQTPQDHSEFQYDSQLSLIALPDSEAAGLIDLWSVIRHELGHLLGYKHTDDGLMESVLDPGERKLADWSEETDDFFASLDDDTELLSF